MTKAKSFRYILRYQIDPKVEAEARLEDLVRLCTEGQIEEVMLLLHAEELSNGHPTEGEWDTWTAFACRVRERLAREGVALSLNPWTTLYQVPRGRALHPGQNFRLMVGETGGTSPVAVCPLCPEWQAMICGAFARLAREVQPTVIWVEDDWRLHNHGPELGWGGCFCAEHLARFSRIVGETVSREQLLDAVLRPGKPHPWRQLWFQLSRETLLEPMNALRKAVHAAHPGTRLGLMSSRPDQHSIEGRDWAAMQQAVGNAPAFLIRPHMEPYTEERALRITPAVTRQTLACLSGPIGVYPELENSPRCGIYSKSGRHTVWQMLEAACIGSPGITINHFDNLGNGTVLDPAFAGHLAAAKPVLSALAALGLDDRQADGAQILFSPQVASHLELPEPPPGAAKPKLNAEALSLQMQMNPSGGGGGGFEGSMQSLVHPSPIWAETCTILGIAHRLTHQIEPTRGPILVNGQTLRAFDNAAIERLLSGCVVLDAIALETLLERGYGPALGIHAAHWQSLAGSAYSYETFLSDEPGDYGVAHPRVCAQRNAGRLLAMEPDSTAQPLSRIHRADGTPLWPGALLHHTPQGGKALSITYPINGSGAYYMAFFNRFRRIFFQNFLLENPHGARLLMGPDGSRVYRSNTPHGTFIAILNAILDPLHHPTLRHHPGDLPTGTWQHLSPEGHWQPFHPATPTPGELSLPTTIEPLKGAYFLVKE